MTGFEVSNPTVRGNLLARAHAVNEAVRAYEKALDPNGDLVSEDEFYVRVEPQELIDALALQPIRTITDDEIVITGMSHGVVLREVMRRLDDPDFRDRLFPRLDRDGRIFRALRGRPHQITDEEFLKELAVRLTRPTFHDTVVRQLEITVEPDPPRRHSEDISLISDELFLENLDERLESKGFAYKVGQLIGERVVGWLKGD